MKIPTNEKVETQRRKRHAVRGTKTFLADDPDDIRRSNSTCINN